MKTSRLTTTVFGSLVSMLRIDLDLGTGLVDQGPTTSDQGPVTGDWEVIFDRV